MTNEHEFIKKIKFFYLNNQSVHLIVKTKSSVMRFYNGFIKRIDKDSFIFNDEKFGEIFLFYNELVRIEPRIMKEVIK